MIRVVEMFGSVQGEGLWIGVPMVFVRTSGCNIECQWCDTPQRKEAGTPYDAPALVAAIEAFGIKDVCFTGGEPMMRAVALVEVWDELLSRGFSLHMETNGTLLPEDTSLPFRVASCLESFRCITVSPKPPSAQVRTPRTTLESRPVYEAEKLAKWTERKNVAVKVVAGTPEDWDFAEQVAQTMRRKTTILVQPETKSQGWEKLFASELEKRLTRSSPAWRFLPRLHNQLWGETPGR